MIVYPTMTYEIVHFFVYDLKGNFIVHLEYEKKNYHPASDFIMHLLNCYIVD